jgi:hypothetical protein
VERLALQCGPVVKLGRVAEREAIQEVAAPAVRGGLEHAQIGVDLGWRGGHACGAGGGAQPMQVKRVRGFLIERQRFARRDQVRAVLLQRAAHERERAAQRRAGLAGGALGPEQRRDLLARVRVALRRQVDQQRQRLARRKGNRAVGMLDHGCSEQCERQQAHDHSVSRCLHASVLWSTSL